MKQYSSLTPERERGHGHVVEFDDVWFPPSSPPAITTTASPRFSKKQLFAVVAVISAAVVLVAVLSHSIKNDGKLGRIGSFKAASIDDGSSDGKNDVVYIYPDVFPQERADEIKAAANLGLLDLGEIFSSWCNLFICALKVCASIFCYDCILPASATGAYM